MIVGLGGGIGAARLWRKLAQQVPEQELVLVTNVAEDIDCYGLRVCPDIDTVLYALSSRQDTDRGWGLRDETFRCMDTLRGLGEDVWFNLGDQDLATHLLRTHLLSQGVRLTDVTRRLADEMGVQARVLPPTDHRVQTRVITDTGDDLHYQEFLVRRGARDFVAEVRHDGLDAARATPEVLAAVRQAELVIIAPSNPLASVVPVLDVPGLRDALIEGAAPVVAVTPVVRGHETSDSGEQGRARSRAALLISRGLEHRASDVASLYAGLADHFVVDVRDAHDEDVRLRQLPVDVLVADTLLHVPGSQQDLADKLLALRPAGN